MKLEDGYDKGGGSGQSTETAYTVEARINYPSPASVAGQIFDIRWSRVYFEKNAANGIGVPDAPHHKRATLEHNLLDYAAAQALRWWLHATAAVENVAVYCLETRLVSHKITTSHSIEAIEAHEYIHGDDRSNIMPDWGKTNEDCSIPPMETVTQARKSLTGIEKGIHNLPTP